MNRDRALTTVLFLLTGFAIFAQEPAPAPQTQTNRQTQQQAEGTAGTGEQPAENDLFRETLALDIRTAGYYELVAWLNRLGIAPKGSREDLQRLLYEHYGITPAAPQVPSGAGQIITIESAENSRYFSIEQVDQQYIRLSGGVILELQDLKNNSTHRISAEEILYNQTEDLFTARGNVEYVLTQNGKDESFTGESITFNINSWEGAFFNGITARERQIDNRSLTFFFSGDNIIRTDEDVILMNDGEITSCDLEDPHYHVSAGKIWILAPGEWGLSNATLYVGHVPVFFIPFFFYPGDQVFFNPAFGYREREGYYLQTTTYLIGQKKQQDSSFSFLQLGQAEEGTYGKERVGLFLRKTDTQLEDGRKREWFLKLMVDIYSKLGNFLGLNGHFTGQKVLRTLDFHLGLGFSRTVYASGSSYSPYYVDPVSGAISEQWNSSDLFGLTVPFRYGFGAAVDLSGTQYSLKGSFDYYSDPYFVSDFRDRSEDIDWGILLGMTEETTSPSDINSLRWQLEGNYRLNTAQLKPYISTLSLSRLKFDLAWNSRLLSGLTQKEQYSPSRAYFYPASITYPEMELKLNGTLFSTPAATTAAAVPSAEGTAQGPALKTPWSAEGESRTEGQGASGDRSTAHEFQLPEIQKNLQSSAAMKPFAFTLGYSFTPWLLNKGVTATTGTGTGVAGEKMDFSLLYTAFQFQTITNLTYEAQVYENLFSLNGSFSFSQKYYTHYNRSDTLSDAAWQGYLRKDYAASALELNNSNTFRYFPFLTVAPLSASVLSYTLDTLLYDRSFRELDGETPVYDNTFFTWSEEYVKRHLLSFSLNADALGKNQSFLLSTTLPPETEDISSTLQLRAWYLSGKITGSLKKKDDEWVYDPLVLVGSFSPSNKVSFDETVRYNIEESYWDSFKTSLRLWGFSSTFNVQHTRPYSLVKEGGNYVWKQEESSRLIPSDFSVGYVLGYESEPVWKDRITFSLNLNTSWRMNLLKFTDNALSFKLEYSIHIEDFLDLTFSSLSQNNSMYLYFPWLLEDVPEVQAKNFFSDLLKSFNFFNVNDRYASSFKISSINVKATHYLHDWTLNLEYQGSPERSVEQDGTVLYKWGTTFSIFLQWTPIPEIKTDIKVQNGELSL